jgi:hypothetical protein
MAASVRILCRERFSSERGRDLGWSPGESHKGSKMTWQYLKNKEIERKYKVIWDGESMSMG